MDDFFLTGAQYQVGRYQQTMDVVLRDAAGPGRDGVWVTVALVQPARPGVRRMERAKSDPVPMSDVDATIVALGRRIEADLDREYAVELKASGYLA